MAANQRGHRSCLQDVKPAAVPGPLDILRLAAAARDVPDDLGEAEQVNLVQARTCHIDQAFLNQHASFVHDKPVWFGEPLDQPIPKSFYRLDDDAAAAADRVRAEGHAGCNRINHLLNDDCHNRGGCLDVSRHALPVLASLCAENGSPTLPYGLYDGCLAGNIQHGLELAGVRSRRAVFTEQR